jgi:hypothetical protein
MGMPMTRFADTEMRLQGSQPFEQSPVSTPAFSESVLHECNCARGHSAYVIGGHDGVDRFLISALRPFESEPWNFVSCHVSTGFSLIRTVRSVTIEATICQESRLQPIGNTIKAKIWPKRYTKGTL